MDRMTLVGKLPGWLKNYWYIFLILGAGIFLMALPESGDRESLPVETPETAEEESLEARLEQILSRVEGAGRVYVMLSERTGESISYQTDEDLSEGPDSSTRRSDTVIVSSSDRSEQGLVRQVNPPVYLGAVIVCQGGDDPQVRLAIVEAVSDVTGLGADRISVLKMK